MSTRPLLLNEVHELDEALRAGGRQAIAEELGDYFFMGLFMAEVLRCEQGIDLAHILVNSAVKLRRRHPHVYGEVIVRGVDQVLANWERMKKGSQGTSLLAGLPTAMPALQQAQLIQERCRRVGFDWQDAVRVLDKVEEEIGELRHELEILPNRKTGRRNTRVGASKRKRVAEELGDLLFALVNFCRHLDIDAEGALKDANRKFRERFERVEAGFRRQGRELGTVPLAELEAAWQLVKHTDMVRP